MKGPVVIDSEASEKLEIGPTERPVIIDGHSYQGNDAGQRVQRDT